MRSKLTRLGGSSLDFAGIPSTIIFIIFWDFFMFYQVFLAPQVKRCLIITYNNGIYELPDELSNDLRRLENIRKVSKP